MVVAKNIHKLLDLLGGGDGVVLLKELGLLEWVWGLKEGIARVKVILLIRETRNLHCTRRGELERNRSQKRRVGGKKEVSPPPIVIRTRGWNLVGWVFGVFDTEAQFIQDVEKTKG